MGITDGNDIYEDWRDHPDVADAINDERALQRRMDNQGARQIGAALYIERGDN